MSNIHTNFQRLLVLRSMLGSGHSNKRVFNMYSMQLDNLGSPHRLSCIMQHITLIEFGHFSFLLAERTFRRTGSSLMMDLLFSDRILAVSYSTSLRSSRCRLSNQIPKLLKLRLKLPLHGKSRLRDVQALWAGHMVPTVQLSSAIHRAIHLVPPVPTPSYRVAIIVTLIDRKVGRPR
jgi:hypothetical protein